MSYKFEGKVIHMAFSFSCLVLFVLFEKRQL